MGALADLSASDQQVLKKVKRYILTYVIVGQLFYQLCRTNIGLAHLTMAKDLRMSAEVFGFASGIFALSAFCMQIPAGLLLEKFGSRKWLTFNMAAWGLVVMGQGLVTSSTQLTVLRFLLGMFEAGFLPGVYVLISIWFRGRQQGVATSFIQMGLGLSALVGGPFAGWILGKSLAGVAGWRLMFFVEGGLTTLWALAALTILNDRPEQTSWLSISERAFMTDYLGEYQERKIAHGAITTSGFTTIFKDSRVLTLLVAFSLSGWIAGTFIFFNPLLLRRAGTHVATQTVGFLSVGPYVLSGVAAYFWSRHADKTERHWHCVTPCLFAITGMLLYIFARTPFMAMLCLSIVQIGQGCFFTLFWPSTNLVVGKQAVARVTAILTAGNLLCSFLAPIFFGWAMDKTGSVNLGLYTSSVTMFVIFLLMNSFFFRYKAKERKMILVGQPSMNQA